MEFINMLPQAIVAIKIHITQFVGKCKLRQIKDNRDLLGACPLKASGKNMIGEAKFAAAAVKAWDAASTLQVSRFFCASMATR